MDEDMTNNNIVRDRIDLVTGVKIYGSLWLVSKIGIVVSPFWLTILLTSFAAVARGKKERENFSDTVPVEIEIKPIEIFGYTLTDSCLLPIRPYTTDVHKLVPWGLVRAHDRAKEYILGFITEMTENIQKEE